MSNLRLSIVLFVAMIFAAFASGQDRLDLSKDPRLQKAVDLDLKRVLLPDLAKLLRQQTDQKFLFASDVESLMVCVFAQKQPLWLVMQDVADVLGCEWKDLGSEWRLSVPAQTKARLREYVGLEADVRRREEFQRAKALEALVASHKWSEVGDLSSEPLKAKIPDETPEQWAKRVVRDPAFYIAGVMFSKTGCLDRSDSMLDSQGSYFETKRPFAFRLVPPQTKEIAETNQCCASDDFAPELSGYQVAIKHCTWAGTLQAVLVDDHGHRAEKPLELIRFPKPTPALAKTPSGAWLLDWETPLDDSKDPILDSKVDELNLKPSSYHNRGQGIEDYLEAVTNATKTLIVCDAFRVPVIGKGPPAHGDNLRTWLASFRDSQKCFVKVQNGSVMIRHGGFWDLRVLEPSERLLTAMEAIQSPGLDDYANFVIALINETVINQVNSPDPNGIDWLPTFFCSQLVPLTKFDPKPVGDSWMPLAAYGQMSDQQRVHVLSGGYVDLHKNVADSFGFTKSSTQWTDRRGLKITINRTQEYRVRAGNDLYLDLSSIYGIFEGGRPLGIEPRLLESIQHSSEYRHLWGDSPDDNQQFWETYGEVGNRHAVYLSLRDLPLDYVAPAIDAPRHMTGIFHFFASVSASDGVINDVSIPEG